jgi:antitoxin MazE
MSVVNAITKKISKPIVLIAPPTNTLIKGWELEAIKFSVFFTLKAIVIDPVEQFLIPRTTKPRCKLTTLFNRDILSIYKEAFSMRTTIKKWGNSQGLRFSKEMLAAAGIQIDDEVTVEIQGNQIVIEKAESDEICLKELFEGYRNDAKQEEMDWGEPEGDEKW